MVPAAVWEIVVAIGFEASRLGGLRVDSVEQQYYMRRDRDGMVVYFPSSIGISRCTAKL